jgi:hypothetical protein
MPKLIANNALTLVLMALFAFSLMGQWLMGWRVEVEDLHRHGQPAIGLIAYFGDPAFLSALFENWESEFLQMSIYVVLTAILVQKGSAESNPPGEPPRDKWPTTAKDAPWPAKQPGIVGWLYAHSLGLALSLLFAASFVLHWLFSARHALAEARAHGEAGPTMVGFLADPQLWFESFQNWQSEFLSTAVLVVLSIFLRQANSPESKPLAAPHGETGA